MLLELVILGLGLYLGSYLTQQLSAGLPEMPGPVAGSHALLVRLYRSVTGLVSESPSPHTLTGEIPADQLPRDPPIEVIVAEQLAAEVGEEKCVR